ncbi:hypothetical protein BX600DRAFT_946 [Xylariales sp. PMI_506]|nr:hypothetical protein BX600DRAFT_946 [Xylariales sp. PMI_506]
MAGLEILAAVCSIFQVISFSHETVTLCKKIYRTGSGVTPELTENAVILGRIFLTPSRSARLLPATYSRRSASLLGMIKTVACPRHSRSQPRQAGESEGLIPWRKD